MCTLKKPASAENMHQKQILVSSVTNGLSGTVYVPGDKSISHRSLILAGMAIGQTQIIGLLRGEDVLSTLRAMQQLGVPIADDKVTDTITVNGIGTCGFTSPDEPLDLGNAGTGVRLIMGAVAGQPLSATFKGDASLSARPMKRITDPLEQMGAQVSYLAENKEKGLLPVTITGSNPVLPLLLLTACRLCPDKICYYAGRIKCERRYRRYRTAYIPRSYGKHAASFWR